MPIARVRGLSAAEFREQHLVPGRPVVLEGVIDGWPALRRWTPDFWRSRFGTRLISTDEGEWSMAALVDAAVASTEDAPAPYLRSEALDDFPGLGEDVEPYPPLCSPNWYRSLWFRLWNPFSRVGNATLGRYELFIGGRGRAFPYIHFDAPGTHTFIHQIVGVKRLLLFAPEQAEWLYPVSAEAFHISRIADAERVSADEFPLFAQAQPVVVDLAAGETLLIPCGWWHFARMQSFSVSVAIDVLDSSSWGHTLAFVRRKLAGRQGRADKAALWYLRLVGLFHGVWPRFR